eukprot:59377_1
MHVKSLQEMKDEYKKSLHEMKDESLEWHKHKIQSYEYWSNQWELSDILFRNNSTSICKTNMTKTNHDDKYVTKIYRYKSKRDLLQIHQEYLIVHKLRLLEYLDIAHGKNHNEIYITMDLLQYTLEKAVMDRIDDHIHDFRCVYTDMNLKSFILDIASYLHRLHSNGYIHCDIKASNVCWKNGWKLIDFGNVKYINTNVYKNGYILSNYYCGSIKWSAPEMSPYANKNKPNKISNKTDIWSFGLLILYVICNGKHLFDITKEDVIKYNLTNKNKKKLFFYDKLREINMDNSLKKLCLEEKICNKLCNLLSLMLKYEQSNRISALDIIKHEYLKDCFHIAKG